MNAGAAIDPKISGRVSQPERPATRLNSHSVGDAVGEDVGVEVGEAVGVRVVGDAVGPSVVGDEVGAAVVGASVGIAVGVKVVGEAVGPDRAQRTPRTANTPPSTRRVCPAGLVLVSSTPQSSRTPPQSS